MPPLTLPPPTILIVEDEPSITSALTRLLTRAGYQTAVARNGQEALSACQQQAYTQILCDLWMPVLDGQGFYEALRRSQPRLCTRVVFLTGDTLTPAVHAFLARTPVPLLAKPFTAERLRALLSERCPSPQPAGEARTAGRGCRSHGTKNNDPLEAGASLTYAESSVTPTNGTSLQSTN